MATEETFLEQIIAQAQHVVLRLRAMFVLDQVSQNLRDPLITFHWSTLSSPTRTSVKVSLCLKQVLVWGHSKTKFTRWGVKVVHQMSTLLRSPIK